VLISSAFRPLVFGLYVACSELYRLRNSAQFEKTLPDVHILYGLMSFVVFNCKSRSVVAVLLAVLLKAGSCDREYVHLIFFKSLAAVISSCEVSRGSTVLRETDEGSAEIVYRI
jgi:hypothetical protein